MQEIYRFIELLKFIGTSLRILCCLFRIHWANRSGVVWTIWNMKVMIIWCDLFQRTANNKSQWPVGLDWMRHQRNHSFCVWEYFFRTISVIAISLSVLFFHAPICRVLFFFYRLLAFNHNSFRENPQFSGWFKSHILRAYEADRFDLKCYIKDTILSQKTYRVERITNSSD